MDENFQDFYNVGQENKGGFYYLKLMNPKVINLLENNYKYNLFNSKFSTDKIENMNLINISTLKEHILHSFNTNFGNYIEEVINKQPKMISENLLKYILLNKYENIWKTIINQMDPKEVVKNLLEVKNISRLLDYLRNNNFLNENILYYTDKEGQTFFHLLSNYFNKEIGRTVVANKKICDYSIKNLYDNLGNTPMYYACKKINIDFIEMFSIDKQNDKNNDYYSLFLDSNNEITPLEVLYKKLGEGNQIKNLRLFDCIINISKETKKGYLIYIIKYVVEIYNNHFKVYETLMNRNYIYNLSSANYKEKVIGIFQYFTKILKDDLKSKDEEGNDVILYCALKGNFKFLFEELFDINYPKDSINNKGKSFIHIIVQSKSILDKEKNEYLKNAINLGFDFNIRDKNGLLPFDYAIKMNNIEIIDTLTNNYISKNLPIPLYNNDFNNIINEDNNIFMEDYNIDDCKLNFNRDSDKLFNESISLSSRYQKCDNLFNLIYDKSKYSNDQIHKLCIDQQSIPYDASLIKCNQLVLPFNNSTNCFVIQLIENTENNHYKVITFQNEKNLQEYEFEHIEEATIKFKEIFKEKTNNEWDIVKNDKSKFHNDHNKYYCFNISFDEESDIYDYLILTIKNLKIKKNMNLNGNKNIREMIYYLAIKAYHNRFYNKENDSSLIKDNQETKTRNLLKEYKKKGISKAKEILEELSTMLKNKKYFEKKKSYLINSYYELIPYTKYNENFNKLDTLENISYEISRLTTYYYIENILKIFLGAIYNLDNLHPLDYIINSLGCEIEELPKHDSNINLNERDYIYNFLYKTGARKENIKTVYKIKSSLNDKNFNLNNYNNRFILCHGTKPENIIGILSQGLKIAPVQANFTGSSYGRGIYLSDYFSFSYQYCFNLINNIRQYENHLFMILAEVAIGKVGQNNDTYINKTNIDFNDSFLTPEGYRILKMTNKKNNFGGIIVAHEETNVRVKYLVEINEIVPSNYY